MANNQLKHLLLIGFLTLSCTGVAYAQAPGTSPVETTASATSTDIQLAGIPFVVSSASSQDPEVAQAIASKIEALIKEYGGSVATQPNADAYNAGLSVQIEYSSDEKYQTYQVKIDESLNGSAAGSLVYKLQESPGFFCVSDKCISEFITTSVFKSPDINDGISGLFLAAIKDKKAFDLKIAEKAKAEAEEKAKAEAEQARSRAEKADAKKTATLTNNPELTNSNTAANEPSTATDSIIAIAIFLAVIFLAYIVIRKTLRGIKRSKYRNKVKKAYENINAIGKYADSNQHIVAFSAKRRLSSDVTIDVLNCYLEVSYPNTASNAKWSASIGYLNKASYAQAMSSYQIAYTQYSIARAQFEAEKRVASARANDGGATVISYGQFNARAPSKPRESDHVDWYIEKGDCSAAIQHNRMISSKASALLTEKLGSVEVNFGRLEAGFFSIYKSLLKRIDSGDVKVTKEEKIIVVTPLTDAELQSTFQSEISAKCLSDAKSRMGGYHKSESIVSCDTKLTRNANIFPITIVFTQAGSGKKPSYVFHDAQFPEIEIS